jgi:DASS family divalent anion:Na+ symporter
MRSKGGEEVIMNKKKLKTIIGSVLGIGFGIVIALITPPGDLTVSAMRAMGIIVWAIIFMSLEVLPSHVITVLMCTAFVLFKCVPFTTAFGAYADTTFWLIIGVLGIGVAINKCGLLKRISYYALKLFPPTYNGIIAALLGVGTICQPLMPSTSAKQSIVAPVAIGMGETLGIEKQSKQMGGLFNAMYIGWSITGTVFISASFLGYLFFGNLPADIQTQFTWTKWFIAMIPWAIIVVLGNYFALITIYKPKTQKKITKEFISNQLKALGPMSRDEKVVCIIMAVALLMWITENVTGISACVTSLLCLMTMFILGVFTTGDFNTKMVWSLIIMVGGLCNIANVMSKLQISGWVGTMIEPLLGDLIARPYLFIFALVVTIYLVRYVMVDFVTVVILFTVVLTPLAQSVGMNPWIVMMTCYCSVCIWVTKYQNANMLVGWAAAGGDDNIKFSDVMPGAYAHLVVNLIALLISVPYWQLLGYIE